MPFQKGQSGNPGGRHAEKPWRDAIVKAVRERDEEGGRQRLELLAQSLVTAGIAGDVSAMKEIGDRLDGKAIQQIAGDDEDGALVVKIIKLTES